jgi:hypothetical protein
VLDHRRPQVGDILVGDVEPGVAELIDGLAEQPGVEGGHTVDDQAEAQGLAGLVGEVAVTDVAVVSEVDRVGQALEGLALVELGSDPFAQFAVLRCGGRTVSWCPYRRSAMETARLEGERRSYSSAGTG